MLGSVVDRKRGRKRKRRSTGPANNTSGEGERKSTGSKNAAPPPLPLSRPQQKKITEYFVARRSNRVPKNELEKENALQLKRLILDGTNEKLLEVVDCGDKGRGVCALKRFEKGEFIVEYRGELIDAKLAKLREEEYAKDEAIGSYMFYLKHNNTSYCVDATEETPFKGRLVNHSLLRPNAKTKVVDFNGRIHLILIARRDIEVGEEILYSYGDTSAAAVQRCPWLINT